MRLTESRLRHIKLGRVIVQLAYWAKSSPDYSVGTFSLCGIRWVYVSVWRFEANIQWQPKQKSTPHKEIKT